MYIYEVELRPFKDYNPQTTPIEALTSAIVSTIICLSTVILQNCLTFYDKVSMPFH